MRLDSNVIKVLIVLTILLYVSGTASAVVDAIVTRVVSVACTLYLVFYNIAAAVAVLIFTASGVKWIVSENDPGARKGAKDAMVHALVGLIIVVVAAQIVSIVVPVSC